MKWLIEAEALEDLKAAMDRVDGISAVPAAEDPVDEPFSVQGNVAHIGINGPLMARSVPILRMFGVQHTGYDDIRAALTAAQTDARVERIQLNVDSPGGQVSGLFRVLDQVKTSQKPVSAVADYAASAAYAIAAATGRIEARGPASAFGSIGVATDIPVSDQFVTITSTNAPDKRPDVTTEDGQAVIRSQLDEIHDLFVGSIADSRGTSATIVNESFGRGRTFLAEEARTRGMIDDIQGSNNASQVSDTQSASAEKETQMDLKTLKAEHPEVFSEACDEATTKERKRVKAHLKMGETTGAMAIALAAIANGTPFADDEVQAEYMSAGQNKRDSSARADDDEEASAALDGKKETSSKNGGTDSDDYGKGFASAMAEIRGSAAEGDALIIE